MRPKLRQQLRELTTCGRVFLRRPPGVRFVIFAQGRTGTWLLYHMLNSHPAIHCDKEILMWRVRFPGLYVRGSSRRTHISPNTSIQPTVYGCHLQINQLLNTQQVDPSAFINKLHTDGWQILYLTRRDIVRQSISTMIANQRNEWQTTRDNPLANQTFPIDPLTLLQWLQRRLEHTSIEAAILDRIPHLPLVYEDDLLAANQHQPTMDRVFAYLGVESVPVHAPTRRISRESLAEYVSNYAEMMAVIRQSKFAAYAENDSFRVDLCNSWQQS